MFKACNNLSDAIQLQVNAGHPPPPHREVNLVRISEFDGTTDPITWIEDFEKAATANGFTNARKLAIVGAYLKGTAADWLRQ